jgi:abequosyltransferase
MPPIDQSNSSPRLSICIATYSRAEFIAATLESIVCQMRPDVELLVVDGASPDRTPEVMEAFCAAHPATRYIREETNSGVDADFDKAVGYARGEYCWLMTDDDLLVPNAIERVCAFLDGSLDLLIVNSEVSNHDFTKVFQPRMLDVADDQIYDAAGFESFFLKTADLLTFIGAVVIKRSLWLERDRKSYYGTAFIHVGVIFQAPIAKIRILADPVIKIRYGNAMWTPRAFEIWMIKWPRLIWSFKCISDGAKAAVTPLEPYRYLKKLIWIRSTGAYSLTEYRKYLGSVRARAALFVALLPGTWLNTFSSLYIMRFGRHPLAGLYNLVRSKNSTWITRRIAKSQGV